MFWAQLGPASPREPLLPGQASPLAAGPSVAHGDHVLGPVGPEAACAAWPGWSLGGKTSHSMWGLRARPCWPWGTSATRPGRSLGRRTQRGMWGLNTGTSWVLLAHEYPPPLTWDSAKGRGQQEHQRDALARNQGMFFLFPHMHLGASQMGLICCKMHVHTCLDVPLELTVGKEI